MNEDLQNLGIVDEPEESGGAYYDGDEPEDDDS